MFKVPVAGAVIIRKDEHGEDELLLIRRSKTDSWALVWEFPRGKVRRGEDVREGLKREVFEETGLKVDIIKFIDKYTYIADRGTRISTEYNFLCKMINPKQEVKLSFEHDEFRWIKTVGEAELLVPAEMKKTIAKVFNTDKMIVSYDMEKDKTRIKENRNIRGK